MFSGTGEPFISPTTTGLPSGGRVSEFSVSPELAEWARRAGFTVTDSSSTDYLVVLWDRGGENRYLTGRPCCQQAADK